MNLFKLFYLKFPYLVLLIDLVFKIDCKERNLTIYSILIMNYMPYIIQLEFVLHFQSFCLLLSLNYLNEIIRQWNIILFYYLRTLHLLLVLFFDLLLPILHLILWLLSNTILHIMQEALNQVFYLHLKKPLEYFHSLLNELQFDLFDK